MPVSVSLKTDIRLADRMLTKVRRQIPFATMLALNETAEDFQKYQRAYQLRVFDVRNRRFMNTSVKWKPRAKKKSLWTRVQIEPVGGKSRADIVAKFETGGRKIPRGQHIAIPVGPKSLTKRTRAKPNLAGRYGPFTHHGGGVYKGQNRTFLITKGGKAGLYQRTGGGSGTRWKSAGRSGAKVGTQYKRKSRVRLLYSFKHSARIPKRLRFIANARRVISREWPKNWRKAWDEAMRTANR